MAEWVVASSRRNLEPRGASENGWDPLNLREGLEERDSKRGDFKYRTNHSSRNMPLIAQKQEGNGPNHGSPGCRGMM